MNLENTIIEIGGQQYKLTAVGEPYRSSEPKKVKPKTKDRKLVEVIDEYNEHGTYSLQELFDPHILEGYTEDSINALALDFLTYFGGPKGYKVAKKRAAAILSMRHFVKGALKGDQDYGTKLVKKVTYTGWDQINKDFLIDNGITSGSSKFYKEHMQHVLTDEEKQKLISVVPLLSINDNDNIIYQMLHGETLPGL